MERTWFAALSEMWSFSSGRVKVIDMVAGLVLPCDLVLHIMTCLKLHVWLSLLQLEI